MRILYHFWISPACRKVRLALNEKGLKYELVVEKDWERRDGFLALNPASEVPVLEDENGAVLADSQAIVEYLEETYEDVPLLPKDPSLKAEARRLIAWFDRKFQTEVTDNLVEEKLMKRLMRAGTPNTAAIRAGHHNIHYHLDYISYLTERRSWLAGDEFSLADIAAAAQLSAVDYLGDVPWEQHPTAKIWYSRIKSRPTFRPLLADNLPGMPAPKHYADLDF
ncbi:FtsZ-binding protein FzlA [Sneathiella chinensis]|uniref:Glutathione S-transferase n=1 Tax=Sneathiella chinensis TaxID=349750 RepID=A0ABQ5U0Q6_9PROT|nr:glutathione S-transferase family protein [Sneathiella chinensis]GLQ05001.1 glutathione S-transferase [Sneathiella chinensis]